MFGASQSPARVVSGRPPVVSGCSLYECAHPVAELCVAGVVGTTTVGAVIAHTHTAGRSSLSDVSGSSYGGGDASQGTANTGSTGGSANFGAGSAILFCVKYL